MQYILSQEEYDEYISLKAFYQKRTNRVMSKSQKKVYDFFKNNKGTTYTEASKAIGIQQSCIHRHVVNLENGGYLSRDKSGKIFII